MLKGREVLKGGGYGGDIEGKGGVGMEGDGQTSSWGMGARSSSIIVPVMCPCHRMSLPCVFVIAVHRWWCWGPRCHSSMVGGASFAIHQWWCGASFAVGGVALVAILWWWCGVLCCGSRVVVVGILFREGGGWLRWRAFIACGHSTMVVWWVLEIVVVVSCIVEGGGGGGHLSPVIVVEGGGAGAGQLSWAVVVVVG